MKNIRKQLLSMAKEWSADKNTMVISLIDQYEKQYTFIERLYEELSDPECTFCEEKIDRYHGASYTLNPLIKEISKLTDACNRTASLIIKTIMNVGIRPEVVEEKSALSKFLEDDDEE